MFGIFSVLIFQISVLESYFQEILVFWYHPSKTWHWLHESLRENPMFYYILNLKITSQSLLNFCIELQATGK